ncbi:MFS transporter [Streptomyces panaciradicis]|uniref:MFS transporter n=1 Tax=Streptomyces panaciradicis TaxID=1470261 RepID=UPI00201CB8C2|nr:MFS transporter [Streptomyces panaciradicis]MCL6675034.1 MFS transporter [Streptomyces panaciradicis]
MATDTTSPTTEAGSPPVSRTAWREVYILAGMRGLSFAGDIAAETAIALQLQAQGAGSYAVMALLLAATVPPVLLSPLTGKVADRFDSRTLIVGVGTLQALVCVAMTLWTSPAVLIALSVLLSAGLAFTHPVFGALPSAIVGKDNVPRASSISQTWAMAGMVAAPGVAGFLIGRFGVTVPLLIDALSFAAVVAGGLLIRTRLHKGRDAAAAAKGGADADKPATPYKVTSDRFLTAVLILSGAVMAAASIINVLIVFYVRETFGASEETFGLIMSAWMLGLIPGGMLVRRLKRLSHEAILIGTFLCIAVAILGTGLAPGVWWILPFYVLGGIGNGAQATVTHILLNVRVPDTHRGRAFAALGAVSNTGPALGYLVGGAILSFTTPRYGFLAAGVFALAALAVFAGGVLKNSDAEAPAPLLNEAAR